MIAAFYVVDETALPPFPQDVPPEAVISAIRAVGGQWRVVDTRPQEIAAVFVTLDHMLRQQDYLVDMAFAGSPGLVLAGAAGNWRLGWFDAALVAHLAPVVDAVGDKMAASIEVAAPTAGAVFDGFRDALLEARSRGFAVAILY